MTDLEAMHPALRPSVTVLPARGETRAVVLVLHGGTADSYEPAKASHLSSRRLNPFAKAVHEQGTDHGVAVWKVEYRVRGWNGPDMSPVPDSQWALDEVRRRHGSVPVVLLGHSMGGRAAVHVLDDPSVVGMVALCPWLPHEPAEGASGKKVVIAHAAADRTTSPQQTHVWASAARPLATSLLYVRVTRTGHSMLRRAGLWTDLATAFSLSWLGVTPSVGRAATKVLTAASATELSV